MNLRIILAYFTISFAFSSYAADPAQAVQQPAEAQKFTAPQSDPSDHSNNGQFFPEDIVLGNKEAKVVLVEYFAPTCPHCAYFHKEIYPKLKEKYIDTGKIAYVQREFINTKPDLEAATLARCAGDTKRFIIYDVLLAQQQSWAFNRNYLSVLTNIGSMAGVSPEQYQKCLGDEAIRNVLMANTKLISRTPGFVGTPVFVINNKLHMGRFSLEDLGNAIDAILK